MKANKENKPANKALKLGSYSSAIIIIALVVAIVINLLVGKLPSAYTKFDLTSSHLFSISDQTKEVVGSLDMDVNVYLIATTGGEAQAITELLDRYAPLSGKLNISYVDPVLYPSFTAKYTSETVAANSLIVESEKRSKVVPYASIVTTDSSGNTVFDGENQLTSAIDYVTSDNLPVMYQITGHGETAVGSALETAISGQNISLQTLTLNSVDAIPDDASCLMLTAPQTDLTDDDLGKITAYMQAGGDIIIISNYTDVALPNFDSLLAEYGVTRVDGIVVEGDSAHMAYLASGQLYPHYLLPDIQSHTITDPLKDGGYMVLYPIAQGLEIASELRSTLTVTPLLSTSDTAYSKVQVQNLSTWEKEAGDIDGPFTLAAAIEDEKYNGKIVVFSTAVLLDESANTAISGGNYDLLLNSLGWVCERESSITVHSKTLSTQYLNINTADGRALNIFFIGLLPLAAIVIGGVVWFRRKKR